MLKRIILAGVVGLIIFSCGTSTVPCGTFTFTGTPHASRGIDMSLNFDFDPAACGAPACNCDTVAYIQIVRIVDITTGAFLSPNAEQTARLVTGRTSNALNGWAVDRVTGRDWGYYGRNDDGSFASYLTPGTNTTDAILEDYPSGWPDECWFDAVSVPVCIDNDAGCVNQLVGYYYWLFFVLAAGDVTDPINLVAKEWHRDAVDESILEWNNDALGLGKNSFPAFSRMP